MTATTAPDTLRRPEDSIGYLLWQTAHDWMRYLDGRLAPLDLSHMQFVHLIGTAWMERQGEVISQTVLAGFCRVDPMSASKVLRALERKALVSRVVHPRDPRAKRILLTPRGWEVAEEAKALVAQAHADYFGHLGAGKDQLRGHLLGLLDVGAQMGVRLGSRCGRAEEGRDHDQE